MISNLSQGELLQIFGIIVAIGRSEHYSISFDYDTEFNGIELRLWHSAEEQDVNLVETYTSGCSFAEILGILKKWTKIIVTDRGEPI